MAASYFAAVSTQLYEKCSVFAVKANAGGAVLISESAICFALVVEELRGLFHDASPNLTSCLTLEKGALQLLVIKAPS